MIPRTLDALRSAVACVLTARGEAPDALRVTCVDYGHGPVVTVESSTAEHHPLTIVRSGIDEAEAVGSAWGVIRARLDADAETKRDEAVRLTAQAGNAAVRSRIAAEASTAARAVEAGE